jgi:hypothetical protein
MGRLTLLCGVTLLALGAPQAQAQAQIYCPNGEGGAASYQAAVECQRQNFGIRRQQAADQQTRQQAYIAQQQMVQDTAMAEQRRVQAESMRQARTREDHRQRAIREAAYAQRRAEQSPDNVCIQPDIARTMLSGLNELQRDAGRRLTVIDAEHLTTRSFDPVQSAMSCHGVFVQTNGARTVGTFSTRLNVAGQPIVGFSPD